MNVLFKFIFIVLLWVAIADIWIKNKFEALNGLVTLLLYYMSVCGKLTYIFGKTFCLLIRNLSSK